MDDAIVVVENVERIMEEEKLSPYQATKKAMEGLTAVSYTHLDVYKRQPKDKALVENAVKLLYRQYMQMSKSLCSTLGNL